MFPNFHLNNNDSNLYDLPQEDIGDQEDPILFQDSLPHHNSDLTTFTMERGKQKQKQKQKHHNHINNNIIDELASVSDDGEKKKMIRRETERQRRMQMTNLCQSLRSLLPSQLIKGKRSVSDHLGEAASYIKDLKEKTHELQIKRDKLKNEVNSSSLVDSVIMESSSSANSNMAKCVNISPFPGGVEISIDSGLEESSFPLSILLEILIQEGHNVVSCVSTQVNGRLYHSIKAEVY
ncbi:transcription factor bHLH36 [Senna tora]|uniref:Transcription factor bHLH36 n=1 Tax=Senna tora TaxID=362788 RepID=A0A834T3N0_9FABA|nr:transcription factor bHLH36 [Senna tora]